MIHAARLRRSRDIAAVRAEGRAVRRSTFVARVRAHDANGTRVAVVAPRSVGSAVMRNRARRRVREAFRRELASTQPAADFFVTVRPEAVSAPHATIVADAASVLREAAR